MKAKECCKLVVYHRCCPTIRDLIDLVSFFPSSSGFRASLTSCGGCFRGTIYGVVAADERTHTAMPPICKQAGLVDSHFSHIDAVNGHGRRRQ